MPSLGLGLGLTHAPTLFKGVPANALLGRDNQLLTGRDGEVVTGRS